MLNSEHQKKVWHEALRYHEENGWNVIPLCPPDHVGVGREHPKTCRKPGKVPWLSRWKQWQTELFPLDWLRDEFRHHPNANVGVMLGITSLLAAIDVDGKNGTNELRKMAGKEGVPPTLVFTSAKGYRLLYHLTEEEANRWQNRKNEFSGGEVYLMGKNLQTVMPPSIHKDGPIYEWQRPGLVLAAAPEWLLNWRLTWEGVQKSRAAILDNEPITERRNPTLTRIAGAMRRHGCNHDEIEYALHRINLRCEPPLDVTEIAGITKSICKYSPIIKDSNDH